MSRARSRAERIAEFGERNFTPFVVGLMVMYLLLAVSQAWLVPRDDSDAKDGPRSGMTPMHDALTGCEYLKVPGGGITPRLDNTGKQVCRIVYEKELPL